MVLTLFLYRRCPLDFCFKLIRFAHTLTGSLKPSLELETHQQHRKTRDKMLSSLLEPILLFCLFVCLFVCFFPLTCSQQEWEISCLKCVHSL